MKSTSSGGAFYFLFILFILFIMYTILTQNAIGYSYALILLGVAAADTAVGLGLFILFFKQIFYSL